MSGMFASRLFWIGAAVLKRRDRGLDNIKSTRFHASLDHLGVIPRPGRDRDSRGCDIQGKALTVVRPRQYGLVIWNEADANTGSP